MIVGGQSIQLPSTSVLDHKEPQEGNGQGTGGQQLLSPEGGASALQPGADWWRAPLATPLPKVCLLGERKQACSWQVGLGLVRLCGPDRAD